MADGVEPRDIAALTPFVGQSGRIQREVARMGLLQAGAPPR